MDEETGYKVVDAFGRVTRSDSWVLRTLAGPADKGSSEYGTPHDIFGRSHARLPEETQGGTGNVSTPRLKTRRDFRQYFMDQAANDFPAIVRKTLDEAKEGSVVFTRTVYETLGIKREEQSAAKGDSKVESKLPRLSELLRAERLRVEKELRNIKKDDPPQTARVET
jgi:hypothetical protein